MSSVASTSCLSGLRPQGRKSPVGSGAVQTRSLDPCKLCCPRPMVMSFLSCLESSSPAGTRGPSDYTCCTRLQVEDTVRASVVSTLHTSLTTSLGAQRRFVQLGSDCEVLAISPWLWAVCPAPAASSPARGTLSSRWGPQLAAGRDPRDLCPSLPRTAVSTGSRTKSRSHASASWLWVHHLGPETPNLCTPDS